MKDWKSILGERIILVHEGSFEHFNCCILFWLMFSFILDKGKPSPFFGIFGTVHVILTLDAFDQQLIIWFWKEKIMINCSKFPYRECNVFYPWNMPMLKDTLERILGSCTILLIYSSVLFIYMHISLSPSLSLSHTHTPTRWLILYLMYN